MKRLKENLIVMVMAIALPLIVAAWAFVGAVESCQCL